VGDLARELKRLDANATAYEEHLAWKNQSNPEKTMLGKQLAKCVNVYSTVTFPPDSGGETDKTLKHQIDHNKWCPICTEVGRQLQHPEGIKSLTGNPPFGVCPAEPSSQKHRSELMRFEAHSTAIQFPNSIPYADKVPNANGDKWPPPSAWDHVFAQTLTARAADPCSAPVLGRARLKVDGLGSSLNNFANELVTAMHSGAPVAMCTPKGIRDPWIAHFKDPGFATCDRCDYRTGQHWDDAWVVGYELSESENHTEVAFLKRFIYKKLFQFTNKMESAISHRSRTHGLDGQFYIGVHIRRGDRFKEANHILISSYAVAVRRLSARVNSSKVFLASDDSTVSVDIKRLLGQHYQVSEQPRLPVDRYTVRGDEARVWPPSARVLEAEENVLVDVALLARSTAFIGTASSNVGRLVYFMREPNSLSISLDNSGDFMSEAG